MATIKLSALTLVAAASISATDVFPMTDADAGTPTTYKTNVAQLRTALLQASVGSGWGATDYLGLGAGTVPGTGMVRSGQGAIVADSPLINSTATWNNVAITFRHLLVNITDTNSASASLFADFQIAGASKWSVTKAGAVTQASSLTVSANGITVTGNSTITGTLSGVTTLTVTTQLVVPNIATASAGTPLVLANGGTTVATFGAAAATLPFATTISSGGITVTGNSTITGTLGGITTLTATTLAGTLSTAAQPNITSVGTLTALTVTPGTTAVQAFTATTIGGTTVTASVQVVTPNVATASSGTALVLANGGTTVATFGATAATLPFATTISAGGLTVTAGGATITAGGLTVSAGTTAVQAFTATTGVFAGAVSGITTLAIGGAFTGATTGAFSSTLTSAAQTITSASATALTAGLNGATNPALQVDASTASSATGIKIKSAAAAAGVALSVITSGTNENLTIDAAGSGTITLGGTSTGAITLTRATTLSNGGTVTAGGFTVSAGTTAVQDLTVNGGASALTVTGGATVTFTSNEVLTVNLNKAAAANNQVITLKRQASKLFFFSFDASDNLLLTDATNNVAFTVDQAYRTTSFGQSVIEKRVVTSWTTSWTIDAKSGNAQELTGSTSATAYTINTPNGATAGADLEITVKNTSGGALGAATWNAVFKLGAAWTNPANGFSRAILFRYDGTNWIEKFRSAVDVAN